MYGSQNYAQQQINNLRTGARATENEGADAKEVLTSIRANTIISSGVRTNSIICLESFGP